jgi:hypothetical protein
MASIAPAPHTRREGQATDDWITPKWLIARLGLFDLDPCASKSQPWPCAHHQLTVGGLVQNWPTNWMVWLNPPYGKATGDWLERLARHGNGVALIFARTETAMFFDHVWPKASALLFVKGRLTFCFPDGTEAPHNSGGPSVLIGYGAHAYGRLRSCRDLGAFVSL